MTEGISSDPGRGTFRALQHLASTGRAQQYLASTGRAVVFIDQRGAQEIVLAVEASAHHAARADHLQRRLNALANRMVIPPPFQGQFSTPSEQVKAQHARITALEAEKRLSQQNIERLEAEKRAPNRRVESVEKTCSLLLSVLEKGEEELKTERQATHHLTETIERLRTRIDVLERDKSQAKVWLGNMRRELEVERQETRRLSEIIVKLRTRIGEVADCANRPFKGE